MSSPAAPAAGKGDPPGGRGHRVGRKRKERLNRKAGVKLAHYRTRVSSRKLGGVWAKGRNALRGLFLYCIRYTLVRMTVGA